MSNIENLSLLSEFSEKIDLDIEDLRGAYKHALAEAAAKLKKETQTNMISRIPRANVRQRYDDTLADAVRISINLKDNPIKAIVHILGTRSRGSGTFRTRFFEGGTRERITKKGSRGRIEPKSFFADAINNLRASLESMIESALSDRLK